LLASSHAEALAPLIFPLTQVISGSLKLASTPRYYPMRFHLCDILTQLTSGSKVFIPVLPYYMEVLNGFNFNKKTTKVSMKPLDFSCILKVAKTQLQENGMKDATLDKIYAGTLTYLSHQSSKITFPELAMPAVTQIKAFLKQSHISNHSRKMKQLLDKVNENSQHVTQRRKTAGLSVGDKEKIAAWEIELQAAGTPLTRYFDSWKGVKAEETRLAAKEEQDKDYDFIPKIQKKTKTKKEVKSKSEGLWDDDGDEESDLNVSGRKNAIFKFEMSWLK
jgi:nucleolar complex protein 2